MYGEQLVTPMSRWRHVQSASTYTAFGIALCATNGDREHTERSVVYWSDAHRHWCYREVSQFLDGRFLPLAADGAPRQFGPPQEEV